MRYVAAALLIVLVAVLVWDSPWVRGWRTRRLARRERPVLEALETAPTGMFLVDLALKANLSTERTQLTLIRLEKAGGVESWLIHNWNLAVPPRRCYGLAKPKAGGRDA